MAKTVRVQVQVGDTDKRDFLLRVNNQSVRIPIGVQLFTNYQAQFLNGVGTDAQVKRKQTLTNLVRAAYLAGLAAGRVEG